MSQQGQGDSRNQQPEPERPQEGQEVPIDPDLIRNIDPVDSNRVLVDVASYNSKVYFAQGYFGVPARLPWTGGETVLDAINFAGGLLPAAEPKDIHLHRPARGGKPARDYHIDLDAIHRGDARANLQIFPNDRLIVGRDPIVQATAELDRAAAPIKAVLKMIREYSRATRSLAATRMPISGGSDGKAGVPPMTTAEQREADIRAWVQFLRDLTPQGSGVHLDGSALREALLKKFTPPAADPAGK